MTYREKLLRKRLTELRRQLADAEARGEGEAYAALCRFKIDEFEAALGGIAAHSADAIKDQSK